MAGSNWNTYLDRLLEHDLTVGEMRLALALARLTLGWRRTENRIGRALIRETARLDGRSFERALTGLVEKELVRYKPGRVGKGNRATYELVLDPHQKAAVERPIEPTQKAAVERPKDANSNGRSGGTQKAALQRPRIGRGKGKSLPAAPAVDLRPIFDAYISTGGSLTLERDRKALARNAKSLIDDGVPFDSVVAAARDLGRERTFPGYLKQRVAELAAAGGPCAWHGLDRSRLALDQLRSCACTPCTEWANAKANSGIGAAA